MRIVRAALSLAALVALASGCTHAQRAGAETQLAKILVPDDQEKALGLQVKQELETKQHARYVQEPQVVAYVKGITGKILPLAERDRPGVKWEVQVIDDPATVNAFATPGGYLYVYSGLLLAASNAAEVAGVLAHEAGHVVGRHSARQMVDALGIQAVVAAAFGENPGALSQVVAGVGGKGLMLANSREDETEADEYGARYASAAGYDPRGLVTFFQKLEKQEKGGGAFAKFLSDHPPTPDRIAHIQAYIAEHHLGGTGGTSPGDLPAVQARIPKPGAAPAAKGVASSPAR